MLTNFTQGWEHETPSLSNLDYHHFRDPLCEENLMVSHVLHGFSFSKMHYGLKNDISANINLHLS